MAGRRPIATDPAEVVIHILWVALAHGTIFSYLASISPNAGRCI
jgi:hypothetical protein